MLKAALAGMCLLLAGCSSEDGRKSRLGETCSKTADCTGDLRCVSQTCTLPEKDGGPPARWDIPLATKDGPTSFDGSVSSPKDSSTPHDLPAPDTWASHVGDGPTHFDGGACESPVFNGTTAYVAIPSAPSLNPGMGDFTLEAWVKTKATRSDSTVVSKQLGDNYYAFYFSSTGAQLLLSVAGTPARAASYTTSFTNVGYKWRHIAVQRRGKSVEFYLDGKKQVTKVVASGGGTDASSYDVSHGGDVHVGKRNTGATGGHFFHGMIYELRVTNAAVYSADFTPGARHAPLAKTVALYRGAHWAIDQSGKANHPTQHSLTRWNDCP